MSDLTPGAYWVRSTDPQYPREFIAEWGDCGRWFFFGVSGADRREAYEALSGPLVFSRPSAVSAAPVERVARAICVVCGDDPQLIVDGRNFRRWQFFQPHARAAIAAMPEPDGWGDVARGVKRETGMPKGEWK